MMLHIHDINNILLYILQHWKSECISPSCMHNSNGSAYHCLLSGTFRVWLFSAGEELYQACLKSRRLDFIGFQDPIHNNVP